MRNWETERSIKGAVDSRRDGGSDYRPSKRRSPWRTQIIGALIGLVIFIVVAGILYLLFGFFR